VQNLRCSRPGHQRRPEQGTTVRPDLVIAEHAMPPTTTGANVCVFQEVGSTGERGRK
jgi:hypothetical protein